MRCSQVRENQGSEEEDGENNHGKDDESQEATVRSAFGLEEVSFAVFADLWQTDLGITGPVLDAEGFFTPTST